MNIKKTFMGFVMVFLLAVLLPTPNVSAKTLNEIQTELKEIERKQHEVQQQGDSLKSNKRDIQKKINANTKKQTNIQEEIEQIDQNLIITQEKVQDTEAKIMDTNKEIDDLTEQLKRLTKEIEEIQDRIKKREKLLKKRLCSIQASGGDVKFIDVLLGAEDFVDFISRSTAVNTILGQDQKLINEHAADQIALEQKQETVKSSKKKVEKQKVELQSQKDNLLALKNTLDEQIAAKGKLLAKLEKEYSELDEYRVSIEEEQQAIAAQTEALEQAKKNAKKEQSRLKALAESQPSNGGNGTFIMPVNGRQSSGYGGRTHPIYKTQKFHHGLDFAVPVGTPLKAAGSGVVSLGKRMGGYGNVIMITHIVNGQQLTTVYAHLSKISVSPGQTVQQGQVIGATGNTGDSTGPHLHFEVHKGSWNGSRSNSTNPSQYLP